MAAAGPALIVLGIIAGILTRLRSRRLHPTLSVGLALWGVGEGLIALACLPVLALYLELLVVHLRLGLPLS